MLYFLLSLRYTVGENENAVEEFGMAADRTVQGIVFNIQKFSVHDGPGIRTVVFLKGCPLRCPWCSNPESQLPREQVLWDRAGCLGCGHCAAVCPAGAVTAAGGEIRVDAKVCTACGLCVRECPGRALKTEGEKKSVREVLDVVLQDRPFYEESGGGLTLSGGEMLMQPRFAAALLRAAKEEGLHTCCETTGFAEPSVFAGVMEPLDLLLFDMKHYDEKKHLSVTGVSNALPLKNMAAALAAGKELLPRIPVIPGFNDSPEDALGFSARLRELGIPRCQLLPFHQFGENKYDLLGRNYAYRDVPAQHREELESWRQVFLSQGIDAFY